jgi:precorrin-4 methylase
MQSEDGAGRAGESGQTPGANKWSTAAQVLSQNSFKPQISGTIILTSIKSDAGSYDFERLRAMAAHGATMSVICKPHQLEKILGELLEHYPAKTEVMLVAKDIHGYESCLQTNLGDLRAARMQFKSCHSLNVIVSEARLSFEKTCSRMRFGAPAAVDAFKHLPAPLGTGG